MSVKQAAVQRHRSRGQRQPEDLPRTAGRRFHRRRLQRAVHAAEHDHGGDRSSGIDESGEPGPRFVASKNLTGLKAKPSSFALAAGQRTREQMHHRADR